MKIVSSIRLVLVFLLLGFVVSGCASKASRDTDTGTAPAAGAGSGAQPAAGALGSSNISDSPDSGASAANDAAAADRSVYYAFDQYEIGAHDRNVIEANAKYLRAHPGTKVRIEGNADERGSREYNLALGQRRADSVMKMMNVLGVRDSQMETVSYGKEKPRVAGHDEDAWKQNRRSDIVYR